MTMTMTMTTMTLKVMMMMMMMMMMVMIMMMMMMMMIEQQRKTDKLSIEFVSDCLILYRRYIATVTSNKLYITKLRTG